MLLLTLLACDGEPAKPPVPNAVCDPITAQADAPPLTAGAPQAGAAEAFLDLPVGTPLSGYTARCSCFGNAAKVDYRKSAYVTKFNVSAGVQTRIPVKAFWIYNGDQDLVILKIDVIYSFDGLVEEMERRLTAATGRNMDGKVVVTTSHSHASYGDFSDQVTYYLGSDRFNYEIFTRMADSAETTAMEAFSELVPARIGVSYQKDWDPENKVYHDRRGDNDTLQFFDDIPAGSYKDPYLAMVRMDTLDGEPIGVMFSTGLHGTSLDGDSAMISIDAPGFLETVFQERFDQPVVVALLQSGAGDASPGGSDDGYARLETVGEYAADALEALWEATPTSADPLTLETVSRSVPETHGDIRVTRNGTVDLYYTPYTEGLEPDEKIYDTDGSILSPIDEFNTLYGGAFCGEDPAYLPGYAPSQTFPYVNCVDVEMMIQVIGGFFALTEEEAALPILESRKAAITAARIGPVAILGADGTTTSDDVLMGFFPGETTAMYTEQFRRRAKTELGYDYTLPIGYSQDHEGYLLIPEDWLTGGYEIDINIWGPLQGEHIMEQLLVMADELLTTEVVEHPDPCGQYATTDYGAQILPEIAPDITPEAGTLLEVSPEYLWTPLLTEEEIEAAVVPDLTIPAQVPRVQGLLQMAWIGGDPGVDFPVLSLEYEGVGGWAPVFDVSGRRVEGGPDFLMSWTPDPQYPLEDAQTHYWWAAWQGVGHVVDRAGLPLGNYRMVAEGKTWQGGETTWPWTTSDYRVESSTFELVPGALTLTASGADLYVSLVAPGRGYRLIGLGGSSTGDNPLPDHLAWVTLTDRDGVETTSEMTGSASEYQTLLSGVLTGDLASVTVEDRYGNSGTLSF